MQHISQCKDHVASRHLSITAVLAQALLHFLQQNRKPNPTCNSCRVSDMGEVFATLGRRISEDPESTELLCPILARLAMSTPAQLGKCIDVFNCDAAPVDTSFWWGCSAGCVRIDGPRLLADHGPHQVGAALSMEACANGAHRWTLRRVSNGSISVSDYLGVCIGTGICLSASPTSGSFNGFVVDFE